jgi:hypothetical protein
LARVLAGSGLVTIGCLLLPIVFDGELRTMVLHRLPGVQRIARAA